MIKILKLLGTIVLLWLVFRVVDVRQVAATVVSADVVLLLLALLFQLASTLTAALRWSMVMSGLDFHEACLFYVRSYFKGSFFNQALPGSIGGDAVKLFEVSRQGYPKSDSFFGIAIDRLLGIVGLLLLNLTATLLAPRIFPPWLTQLIITLSAGGLAGFAVLVFLRQSRLLSRIPGSAVIFGFSMRLKRLFQQRRLAGEQLLLSVVVHIFAIFAVFCLARAVGLTYSPLLFMVAVPPVLMLTILPISLAGWGIREGAMVGIFVLVGAAKSTVLSVSILYGLLLIVASLPGLLFWLRSPDSLY